MTKQTTFTVKYREKDGYHLFTSEDVRGLFVGGSDCEEAFLEVAGAIELLMRVNYNVDCKVEPEQTPEEFLKGRDAALLPAASRPFSAVAAA